MKKNLLILTLMFSVFAFGQSDDNRSKTMGFYINPNLQIGYNLGNSIKNNQNQDSPSKNLIQEGGLFIYRYNSSVFSAYFIGLSVGATVFSNKNYTVYG